MKKEVSEKSQISQKQEIQGKKKISGGNNFFNNEIRRFSENSKVLLFHDTFLMKGGAERMNIEIAKILEADTATATWSKDCYDAQEMGFKGKILEVNPGFKRGMLGFLVMKMRFLFSRGILTGYEKILFSNEAISAIWGVKKGIKTYYYAHSISRHLFDQYNLYLSKVPNLLKPFYRIFAFFLRKLYIRELQKVGTIFVNSQKNKDRMKEWTGRDDAIILYPPVDTKIFKEIDKNTISQIFAIEGVTVLYKDYYLSFSRLTHAKRIDTIIEAFKKLPDKKILILSGKNDSQREEFMRLGEGYDNIIFHTLENNEHLPHIIHGAIASIAISEEEDFGMVAIESMACGVPVIAVDEGGYRETMQDGETGYMISSDGLLDNLITTLHSHSPEEFASMRESSIQRAHDFSLDTFRKILLQYLK